MFTILSMIYAAMSMTAKSMVTEGFSIRLYNMYDNLISKVLPKKYSNAKTNAYMFFIIGLGLSGSLFIDQLLIRYAGDIYGLVRTICFYVFTVPMTFIFNVTTNNSVERLTPTLVFLMMIVIALIIRVFYWIYCCVIDSLEDKGAYDAFYYDFKGVSHGQYCQYKRYRKLLHAIMKTNKIDTTTEFYRFLVYVDKLNAAQFVFMNDNVWFNSIDVLYTMYDLINHDQESWIHRIIDSSFYESFYSLMTSDEHDELAKKQYAKSMGITYSSDNNNQQLKSAFTEKTNFISECLDDVWRIHVKRVREHNRYGVTYYGDIPYEIQDLQRFLLSEDIDRVLNDASSDASAKELV